MENWVIIKIGQYILRRKPRQKEWENLVEVYKRTRNKLKIKTIVLTINLYGQIRGFIQLHHKVELYNPWYSKIVFLK